MPPPQVSGPAPIRLPPVASPKVPDHAVDVAKIDLKGAEFKALPPEFQKAVREAKTYSDKHFKTMAPPPQVLVTPAVANGNAPVTVIVPPGAKEPLTVQTHYHGDRATSVAGENAAADEIGKRVKAGDSTVYVLPEAKRPAAAGTDWNNATDIGKTTAEALKHAGLEGKAVGTTTISVHSAGGRALANAVKNGEKLTADELVLQDALFERENGPGAYTALKGSLPQATAGVKAITIVPANDNPQPDGRSTRSKVLAQGLRDAGRTVSIAPAAPTHGAAAGVLNGARAVIDSRDHFVR
jgi:hypothetical protein